MKRLLTLLFTLTVALLISSCATFYPNQKKLIGTWKPEKVEKYNMPDLPTQAAANQQKARPGEEGTTPATTPANPSRAESQLARLIENEKRSMLTFNADKTALVDFHGKTIKGTWKLKKQGTRLLASSKETEQKLDLEILHVNDTSAVMIETLPFGSLKITYKKVKP